MQLAVNWKTYTATGDFIHKRNKDKTYAVIQ